MGVTCPSPIMKGRQPLGWSMIPLWKFASTSRSAISKSCMSWVRYVSMYTLILFSLFYNLLPLKMISFIALQPIMCFITLIYRTSSLIYDSKSNICISKEEEGYHFPRRGDYKKGRNVPWMYGAFSISLNDWFLFQILVSRAVHSFYFYFLSLCIFLFFL